MLVVMTAAMVLSAGLGTRLRPLTDELPKPLMPVGDGPALGHIVLRLRASGIARCVVNTHHRAEDLRAWAQTVGGDVQVMHEPQILGTAGGVAHAEGALGGGDVIVWNGDILAPTFDVARLVSELGTSGSGAVWGVAPRRSGEGTVGLDEGGRIVRLRGRRFGVEHAGGDFIGIQVMGAELRKTLPAAGCLVADVALPFLARGGTIGTVPFLGDWDDIGNPASLLRANLRWLERTGRPNFRSPSAEVSDAVELRRSLVGEGAVVTGRGRLESSVVFPGARTEAPLAREIVGVRARVAVAPDP
jgi:mannose-1-phosphate guanylyltransferase